MGPVATMKGAHAMHLRAILALLIASASPAASGQGQGLAVAGPVDPVHGFPQFYRDKAGRSLQPCLDIDAPGDPCGIADFRRIVFPATFPGRFVYWRATTRIRGLGGNISNRADLAIALEGAFAPPGGVADGKQIVVARWRIRAPRGLLALATYTVIHPFGVKTVVADATGAIDVADEQGCTDAPPACDFKRVLTATDIGPFLTWDSARPSPPPGFIGDPDIEHTVTGSPLGTNVFRIDGPNAGGPNRNSIETNLFTVTGKISTGEH